MRYLRKSDRKEPPAQSYSRFFFPLMVQLKPPGPGSPFSSLGLACYCRELGNNTNREPERLPDGAEGGYKGAESEEGQ